MKTLLFFSIAFILQFYKSQELNWSQALDLLELPKKCIYQEYPNKLSNVLASEKDLDHPKNLHPTFYGCFDWHSSVHGHWSLAYLVNKFPALEDEILPLLETTITAENVQKELAYFAKPHVYSYERTYGWSWLMKLQLELETSSIQRLNTLAIYLKPLTHEIRNRYVAFLPKLLYPLRIGTHSNTGFGLGFAYDYALRSRDTEFQQSIEWAAKKLFLDDVGCPLSWEPSGTDFLSPCLEELDLMRRILPEKEFLEWSRKFLPELWDKNFSWQPAKVSDRTDGHLVHLDGLNFSRAWVLYGLVHQYPSQFAHLQSLADRHFQYSLPELVDGNYEGEHWLASFALYTFQMKEQK